MASLLKINNREDKTSKGIQTVQNHALHFQLNERCLGTMILPRAHNAQPKSNASGHLLEISHGWNVYCLAYCMLQLMLALADREGSRPGIY